jgi:type IV pilus assembly protein PilC
MGKFLYLWRGVDRNGQPLRGRLDAANKEELVATLRQQRIRITGIQREFNLPKWFLFTTKSRTSPEEITRFTRQLATLIQAGVPLLQAFSILRRGERNTSLKTIIESIHKQIEGGTALNQALRLHPEFDGLYCNLVAVGELAGMLDIMLERLANHLEKSEALRVTIRSALVYPCAVLGIAATVLILILAFVVPAFQNIFTSFGAELPWLTRCVIDLSEELQRHGLWALTSLCMAAWWLQKQIKQREQWRQFTHGLLLRLPIAGPLTRHACTARWTRTLATLFTAGVPLTEALEAVQDVKGHLLFQSATQSIQAQLMEGHTLSYALEHTHDLFPSMVIQMCAIGEESGALDHMLEKTAEYYEREVDSTVARLSTLLEPFIMVVLGVLIGGLVMALYLPIFQLGQVV